MYLFDTDVLSNVLKKRRSATLMARLKMVPKAAQFTTAANTAEIYFGVFRKAGRQGLLRSYEEEVFPRLTVLPFDLESARVFGRIKAYLESRGLTIFEPDLEIASIALAHKLTLVTGNTKHYSGIPGLRVENWLS